MKVADDEGIYVTDEGSGSTALYNKTVTTSLYLTSPSVRVKQYKMHNALTLP